MRNCVSSDDGHIVCQLINLCKKMILVLTSYQVLEQSFLSNASDLDLEIEARIFVNKLSDIVSPLFPSQMLSIKTSFREKDAHLKSAKKMASFLIVETVSLSTTYSDVCTTYIMCMTVSVTVATEKRSLSKLKRIKNFLRNFMSQERISGLALLSIENERAENLDF